MTRLRRAAALVLVAAQGAFVAACPAHAGKGVEPSPPAAPGPEVRTAPLVLVPKGAPRPAASGAVAFVEIAATHEARERGLMGRDRLERDHGMLFVYRTPQTRRFWMKDCRIGLDIAFLDVRGSIVRLATLPPGVGRPAGDVPAAESGVPVLFVLEMESGWFARHGLGEGDRVDVAAAVAGVVPQ